MDESPTLHQLLDTLNRQVAILAHQIDMLQISNSICLIHLSLMKSSTKPSSIPPPIPNPSINTQPLLPTPNPPRNITAASSTVPSSPLDCLGPNSAPSALYLNNTSSLLDGNLKYTSQPSDLISPKQIISDISNNLKCSNFKSPSPKSLLEKLTMDLALSNSMNKVYEFHDQYTSFPPLPFENDLFGVRKNEDLLNIRQHIVYAEKNYLQCLNNVPPLQKYSNLCTALISNWKIIGNSLKNKLWSESKIYIFDPGGTFTVESIFDLEDKVDFKGMVMIRLYLAGSSLPSNNAPLFKNMDLRPKTSFSDVCNAIGLAAIASYARRQYG